MAYYNHLVRPVGIDQYEIIAGERRFKHVNLPNCMKYRVSLRMSVIVKESHSVVENLQREALNPIEAAEALSKLIDRYAPMFLWPKQLGNHALKSQT